MHAVICCYSIQINVFLAHEYFEGGGRLVACMRGSAEFFNQRRRKRWHGLVSRLISFLSMYYYYQLS